MQETTTAQASELYVPPYSVRLCDIPMTQIRLGLQGYAGLGKTWSALSAPNPLIANFDNKLTAHRHKQIPVIPFHNSVFVNEVRKTPNTADFKVNPKLPPNIHDCFLVWLKEEGFRLTNNQTLIPDSWTSLMNSFELFYKYNPVYQNGKENSWAPYTAKIAYAQEVMLILKSLSCHVIVTFHETDHRDKTTKELTGKIRPLMSGQFADQIAGHFTDWYRMHHVPKVKANGEEVILNKGTPFEYKIQDPNGEYFWQTKSDDTVDCCCSMPDVPMMVRADFSKVFLKKEWL